MTANKRYLCNAVQFSDQMSCSCGNVWDMNDPEPPTCRKMTGAYTQGEPVYLYRRLGLHDFVTCNHDRYAELSMKPHLFETKVLYTAPQPAEQQPAPDVAALLNRIVPRIDAGGPNPIDPDIHCCEWTLHRERERIHAEFAVALAAHHKQQEGQP